MKRLFYTILAAFILVFTNIPLAWAEAADMTNDAAIPFSVPVYGDFKLDVECVSEAAQLYFLWDEPPGVWTLTAIDGEGKETEYECGGDGFLHEYVKLDFPVSNLRFNFGRGGVEGSVYAFGEGEPPDWVEKWEPPHEKADLLVLPENPGDEYLYFGGTLPYYADKGKNIQVAYALKDGDEETDTHKILTGLYSVGLRAYPVISRLEDDGADGDVRTVFYADQIRRFKPEVVLGQYSDDAQSAMAAADVSGEAGKYTESMEAYGVWDTPKIYLHGFAGDEIIMDWHTVISGLNGKTSVEAAREAFFAQFPESPAANDRGFIMLRGSDRFGLYRSAVGQDSLGGDFFENTARPIPPEMPPVEPKTNESPIPDRTAPEQSKPNDIPNEETPDVSENRENDGRSHAFLPLLGASAVLCLVSSFLIRYVKH